jgi:hypothetical protein
LFTREHVEAERAQMLRGGLADTGRGASDDYRTAHGCNDTSLGT